MTAPLTESFRIDAHPTRSVVTETEASLLRTLLRVEVLGQSLVPAYEETIAEFMSSIALRPSGRAARLTLASMNQLPVVGLSFSPHGLNAWISLGNALFNEPAPQTLEERRRLDAVYLEGVPVTVERTLGSES